MTTVSTRPYLLRAIWEWCMDQGFTPYLAARVDEHTRVPPGFARDGQIVLNLSPDATGQLQMGNELITFQARFGGVAHSLVVPVDNVLALYARENGQGMAFSPEDDALFGDDEFSDDEDAAPASVEIGLVDDSGRSLSDSAAAASPAPVKPAATSGEEGGGGDSPRPPRGGHLKIVK